MLYGVPDVKEKSAFGLQYAVRLTRGLFLVRKEHDSELANDGVERLIRKRQLSSVCLSPFNNFIVGEFVPGKSEHRFIEISGHNSRPRRASLKQVLRHDSGATGQLQDRPAFGHIEPRDQISRVRLEQNRAQIAVVVFGNFSDESCVFVRHRLGRFSRKSSLRCFCLQPQSGVSDCCQELG